MGFLEEFSAGSVTSCNNLVGMEGRWKDGRWGWDTRRSAADEGGVDGGESSVASGTAVTVLVAVTWLPVREGGVEATATAVEVRGHGCIEFGGLWFGVIGDDLRNWGKEVTSSSILIARVRSGRSGRVSGTFSSQKASRDGTEGKEGFPGNSGLMVWLSRVGSLPGGVLLRDR